MCSVRKVGTRTDTSCPSSSRKSASRIILLNLLLKTATHGTIRMLLPKSMRRHHTPIHSWLWSPTTDVTEQGLPVPIPVPWQPQTHDLIVHEYLTLALAPLDMGYRDSHSLRHVQNDMFIMKYGKRLFPIYFYFVKRRLQSKLIYLSVFWPISPSQRKKTTNCFT